ncbi:EF-hand [Patellaria atrata CBS 101060]|uniref:EF-hand n=1 Tax=Patellaria atrata CBS 101060 TaxID=1346257 RepID=A0A9P4VQB0_9PEZI|nr:EF-hand [Patellaria atrata CBS 101060]
MAYNKGYNPDALPAHAEPDQAAAIISGQSRDSRDSRPPPRTSSRPDAYSNKPLPGPGQLRPDDRYGGRNTAPPLRDRYDDRPRYDDRYDNRQNSRYSDSHQSHHGYGSPPPPADYGHGPPPQGYHNRPPARPPPTPALPSRDPNDRDALWRLFGQVDKDRSGQLTESELRAALVNGDYSSFDPHTVKMMIRMFDTDRSGTINFEEFCGLWGFLSAWRGLFDRFDADRSGSIQYHEFTEALVAFGYRLSPQFTTLLFRTYDRRGDNAISFDLFVQACISLKRMTDVFKKYDEDRDGYITLSFEEFLTEIISQR